MTATTNLGRVAFVPRGTWDAESSYTKLNVVTYSGSSYVAIRPVPEGTPLNDSSYWQLLASKGTTGGIGQMADTFSIYTNYAVGDYCTYDDSLYRFITAHPAPTWIPTEVSLITAEAFDQTQTYLVGEYVIYNGGYYIWNTEHSAGVAWDYEYVTAINASAFYPETPYETGDYCIYDNNLYIFVADHYVGAWDSTSVVLVTIGNELKTKANASETADAISSKADATAVQTALAGKADQSELCSEFDETEAYATGDYVIYNGALYQFTSDHSAGAWNSSDVTPVKVMDEVSAKADSADIASAIAGKADRTELSAYLPLVGGTMSGNIDQQFDDIDFTASAPSEAQYTDALEVKDTNGHRFGQVNFSRDTNGNAVATLAVMSENANGIVYYDGFRMALNVSTGGLTYTVPASDAFRNAIGASNGVFPTSVGGTGGTDSGWQSLTNSSVYSGTIQYRKIGKFVCVRFWNVKLASNLTSASARTLTALPSGYRPHDTYGYFIVSPDSAAQEGRIVLNSNGNINIYKGSTNITTSHSIHGFYSFMIS